MRTKSLHRSKANMANNNPHLFSPLYDKPVRILTLHPLYGKPVRILTLHPFVWQTGQNIDITPLVWQTSQNTDLTPLCMANQSEYWLYTLFHDKLVRILTLHPFVWQTSQNTDLTPLCMTKQSEYWPYPPCMANQSEDWPYTSLCSKSQNTDRLENTCTCILAKNYFMAVNGQINTWSLHRLLQFFRIKKKKNQNTNKLLNNIYM